MTAQPLGTGYQAGPAPVPRTYNSIVAALPGDSFLSDGPTLPDAFTAEYHEADVFSAPRTLEHFGQIADALADPGTYAALRRSTPAGSGIDLLGVLDEADW